MSDAALDARHGEYMRNGNRRRVEDLTLQGWSATQIGRALGISPSTVYAHRHAAKKRSREPLIATENVAHSVARNQLKPRLPLDRRFAVE